MRQPARTNPRGEHSLTWMRALAWRRSHRAAREPGPTFCVAYAPTLATLMDFMRRHVLNLHRLKPDRLVYS